MREQMRQSSGVGQIINADNRNFFISKRSFESLTADTAETVDGEIHITILLTNTIK